MPEKKLRKMLLPCLLAFLLLSLPALANNDDDDDDRPFGDVRVLAPFPEPPGFPEGIAIKGNKVYVAGPARFGTAGQPPSVVVVYNRNSGTLLQTIEIQGEDLAQEHANSCLAFDGKGRLYVVNTQLGIVRINLKNGQQEVYAAPLPNLAPLEVPPLPNDLAFDPEGYLYETDSLQGLIWRIPPGGGQPQIWFQDPRIATPFGPNGIRLSPDCKKIYFAVTADGVDAMGNFTGGKIYTLPVKNAPKAADLKVFHQYNGEGPDGIVFGEEGRLYVILASPGFSGISILRPNGNEKTRLGNEPGNLVFPYNSPANGAFDGEGSLLVTNHAFAIPGNVTVLDVFVDDEGSPLVKPNVP